MTAAACPMTERGRGIYEMDEQGHGVGYLRVNTVLGEVWAAKCRPHAI